MKRTSMPKAGPARRALATLPDLSPYLENELNAARNAWDAFLAEFKRQPMKWGLAPFEDIARPYVDRIDLAHQQILDYLDSEESHLTRGLACLAISELEEIILSEHQSQLGRRARDANGKSEDGLKWNSRRIADAARVRDYASAPDKDSIIKEIVSRSGRSESFVRRALKEHGLSKVYSIKKPS